MTRLLHFDLVALLRDRLALAAVAVFVGACLVAVLSGHAWSSQLIAVEAAAAIEARTVRAENRAAWAAAADGPAEDAVLLPGRLRTTIALARPLLPDFSVGRSALEPTSATARMSTRSDALFARYQVENAERLARGTVDLSFVAVVLAPLILIALGYGVFAADREAGTARLWLAQAGTPIGLLAARSINRLALVAVPLVASGFLLLVLGTGGDERVAAVAAWLGLALLSLLFWWAVILLVNSWVARAETSALLLVGTWAGFTFVVPALSSAVATLTDPAPSRFEVIAVARQAEVGANRSYEDDHPELSNATLTGRRDGVRKSVEVRRSVDEATAPIVRRQQDSEAARRRTAELFALTSPPALTAEALAQIAHTDARFYSAQRSAAVDGLRPMSAALTRAGLVDRGVSAESFDRLPGFTPPAAPPLDPAPVAWLVLLTLALFAWAVLRLRAIRPL